MIITWEPDMVSKYFNLFHTVEISGVLFLCLTWLSNNFEKLLKMQQIRGIDRLLSIYWVFAVKNIMWNFKLHHQTNIPHGVHQTMIFYDPCLSTLVGWAGLNNLTGL